MSIEIMSDLSEIIHYEYAGMPLYIQTADLSVYPDMSAPCHWHDDIEWIHILSGKMNYYINGKHLTLNTNDSLMINARQMHYGYSYKRQDCRFSCILFHPSLFCNNRILREKYITPVLESTNLEYLYFDSKLGHGQVVSESLIKMVQLKESATRAYELEAIAIMHSLWSTVFKQGDLMPNNNTPVQDDLLIQKNMVSFIYQHFKDIFSLKC